MGSPRLSPALVFCPNVGVTNQVAFLSTLSSPLSPSSPKTSTRIRAIQLAGGPPRTSATLKSGGEPPKPCPPPLCADCCPSWSRKRLKVGGLPRSLLLQMPQGPSTSRRSGARPSSYSTCATSSTSSPRGFAPGCDSRQAASWGVEAETNGERERGGRLVEATFSGARLLFPPLNTHHVFPAPLPRVGMQEFDYNLSIGSAIAMIVVFIFWLWAHVRI